jgi:hypothetical protein
MQKAGKKKWERSWREIRSGKGVGGKEQAGKNKLKNERERIGGKEVSWRNRAGKYLLQITSGNGVGGKQVAGNNRRERTSGKE